MKRNYISPEYTYTNVNGTFNTVEESSFFGSKMLKIDDSVIINNQNIIYYQNQNGEQINLSVERLLPSVVYSSSDDKLFNHTLILDETQNKTQLNSNTRWILTIDLKTILTNYIFALLKENRTFEGVLDGMTSNNDVDFFIKNYITNNVFGLYRFTKMDLFLKYNSIIINSNLRFQNSWNNTVGSSIYQLPNIQTSTTFDYTSVQAIFSQKQISTQSNFNYFFILYWNRI